MDLLDQIRADYEHFPKDQSFYLYADDVYFKDPLNEFRGVKRYQEMIGFMEQWFQQVNLDLHDIRHGTPQRIDTRWTLSWVAPAPWKPAMSIPGRSELEINDEGKIVSHIDYWDCSKLAVLGQLFGLDTGKPVSR